MANNSLEKLSPDQIAKRRKFLLAILWVYIVIGLAEIGLFLATIILDDLGYKLPSWSALVIILMWIPIIAYRKVNQELVRRTASIADKE